MIKRVLVKNFKYGGGHIDVPMVVEKKTGIPIHPVCGFLLNQSTKYAIGGTNTGWTYAQCLKQFYEELVLFNNLDWKEINNEILRSYFYGYLFREKKLSGKSLIVHQSAISSFYKWAYETGFIETPLSVETAYDLPEYYDRLNTSKSETSLIAQYISKEDFKTLLGQISSKKTYIQLRDEIVLMLGYHCGLRTHEVTHKHNLRVEQLATLINKVKAKKEELSFEIIIYGKGNDKPRKIFICPSLFDKIDQFLKYRMTKKLGLTGPLIVSQAGNILNKEHASKLLSSLKNKCESCTEEKWHNYHYHSLRHTYATNLAAKCYEKGWDWHVKLPERLGHEHWSTSQIYVEFDAILNDRIEVLNRLKVEKTYKNYNKGK